ncbi:MAG: glycosyltransferase [Polyangiales bacterium]
MSPPAKVAFLIWSLEGGGAERQLVTLVQNLDRARFEPHVIVRQTSSAYGDLGAPMHSLEVKGAWTPAAVARLTATLRGLAPDLLHTEMDPENMWGRLAARVVGVRRVVSAVRCPLLPLSTRISERVTARWVHRYVANSVGIRDALARDCGVDPARVEVIENGVDLRRFDTFEGVDRDAVRRGRGVGEGPWILLPGRISPEKNQLRVVRALASLRREGRLPPGLRVTLAGADGLDPMYVRDVDAAMRDGGLEGIVERPGFVRDVDAVLASVDAVILPSAYEGISNAVIEAMAMGAPVAVSEGANADAVIVDGEHGWTLGAPTEPAIASTLRRILETSGDARRAMGQRGRASARRRFTHTRMVAAQQDLYDRLLVAPTA